MKTSSESMPSPVWAFPQIFFQFVTFGFSCHHRRIPLQLVPTTLATGSPKKGEKSVADYTT
jgi:hypothetical protein